MWPCAVWHDEVGAEFGAKEPGDPGVTEFRFDRVTEVGFAKGGVFIADAVRGAPVGEFVHKGYAAVEGGDEVFLGAGWVGEDGVDEDGGDADRDGTALKGRRVGGVIACCVGVFDEEAFYVCVFVCASPVILIFWVEGGSGVEGHVDAEPVFVL
jgi:hypothetical protein